MYQKNSVIHFLVSIFLFFFSFLLAQENQDKLIIKLRERVLIERTENKFQLNEKDVDWNPKKTSIVIIDMWDNHHCSQKNQPL